MKVNRIVAIAVLCAALIIGYWLGYRQGLNSKSKISVTLTPNQLNPNVASSAPIQTSPAAIPPRDPAAGTNLIDLSSWYNAQLIGGWHGSRDNDFGALPMGLQTFAGTEFDARGLIQLYASDRGAVSYPRQVNDIRLGIRCHKLHFLHNTLFGRMVSPGQGIGAYILHYADGDVLTIPLRLGENILDWYASPENLPPDGPAVLAWKGTNAVSARRGQNICLLKFTWENPRPDVEITTLDFMGQGKTAGPFLVALTVEP